MRSLCVLLTALLVVSACADSESSSESDGSSAPLTTSAPDDAGTLDNAGVEDGGVPDNVGALEDGGVVPTSSVVTGGAGPSGDLAKVSAGWTTDFSTRTIELDELLIGIRAIPIRDRIPPIDNPKFVPASEAGWADPEPGVLVVMGEVARFYPLAMLIVHEIVNDEVEGRAVLVTYCPLCNSALVFDPLVDGQRLRFGTSGLLRNSDLVMWDDATESLWQQIGGEGLVGVYAGHRLTVLPSAIVSWRDFRDGYPDGQVLAPPGVSTAGYGINPYTRYTSRAAPIEGFFSSDLDDRFPALERTVGVMVNGQFKAYPFSVVQAAEVVNDVVADVPLVVFWSPGTADALDSSRTAEGADVGAALAFDRRFDGEPLEFSPKDDGRFIDDRTGSEWNVLGQAIEGELAGGRLDPVIHTNEFWFAWAAFHPGADVYAP